MTTTSQEGDEKYDWTGEVSLNNTNWPPRDDEPGHPSRSVPISNQIIGLLPLELTHFTADCRRAAWLFLWF